MDSAAAWSGSGDGLGSRPQELLQAAGLEPRLIRSIYADSATTLYEVRSQAGAPEGNSAGLVHAEKIAGTGVPHPRIERLAELVAASQVRVPAAISERAVREHLDRIGPDRDPVDLLARLQLLCTTADDPRRRTTGSSSPSPYLRKCAATSGTGRLARLGQRWG